MIEVLRIENLALVESVELEFGPGLNVLTGETGAGKSIVLSALGLLAGGRPASDALRSGTAEGGVEALFRMDGHEEIAAALDARDLTPPEPDPEGGPAALIVRRSLHAGGRSRARIGGQLVPIATLAELFSGQLEISSQHGSQALRHPELHGVALDAHAGQTACREQLAAEYARVVALDRAIASLRSAEEERARRLDFLEYQRQELEAENLDAEEVAALEADHRRLTHAERLAEEMGELAAVLAGGDAEEAGASVESLLARARRALVSGLRMDPSLETLAVRLEAVDTELRDLAITVGDYLNEVEVDPTRLAEVEERIARLERLRRKYGRGVEEMLAHRDEVEREIATLVGADDRIRSLEAERKEAVSAANRLGAALSRARASAAVELARAVEAELGHLAMVGARFAVDLGPDGARGRPEGLTTGPTGRERPEFHFSANEGEPLRPLQRVASGGELSRLFLAIKNGLRRAGRNMVIVFDEVDAGIGGAVAERVGRVLAELAEAHQVICITHLPQIAARADRHFVVRKEGVREGAREVRTRTVVGEVRGEERVDELARMAGGETVTEVTREHARSLLRP